MSYNIARIIIVKIISCVLAFVVICIYDFINGDGFSIKWDIFLAIVVIAVQSIVEFFSNVTQQNVGSKEGND